MVDTLTYENMILVQYLLVRTSAIIRVKPLTFHTTLHFTNSFHSIPEPCTGESNEIMY